MFYNATTIRSLEPEEELRKRSEDAKSDLRLESGQGIWNIVYFFGLAKSALLA